MRIILFLLLYGGLGFPLLRYGEGWMIMALSVVCGMAVAPPRILFWGFLAGFLLWVTPAVYLEFLAATPLSPRVSAIFGLPENAAGAILLTGLSGGVIGTFYSWMGKAFVRWIKPPEPQRRHPRYAYRGR